MKNDRKDRKKIESRNVHVKQTCLTQKPMREDLFIQICQLIKEMSEQLEFVSYSLRVDRQRSTLLNQIESYIGDEHNVLQHTCGDMLTKCQSCQSLNFKDEMAHDSGRLCCAKGQINPQPLPAYPESLRSLLTMQDPLSKNFRGNIRSINSSFAFASMGANFAKLPNRTTIHISNSRPDLS